MVLRDYNEQSCLIRVDTRILAGDDPIHGHKRLHTLTQNGNTECIIEMNEILLVDYFFLF